MLGSRGKQDFTDEESVQKELLEKEVQQRILENRLAVLRQFLTKYGHSNPTTTTTNNTNTYKQSQQQHHQQQNGANNINQFNADQKLRNSDSHETATTSEKKVAKSGLNHNNNFSGVSKFKNGSSSNVNNNNSNNVNSFSRKQLSQRRLKKEEKKKEVFSAIGRTIQKLMKHQDAKLFNEPVDVVKYCCPDYYRVIEKPMDLSTLLKNVETGVYQNPKEVKEDMDLIWSNCYLYNGELHEVSLTGKRMQQTALRQWQNSGVVKKWEQIEAMEDSEQEMEPEPPAAPAPTIPPPPPVTRPPPPAPSTKPPSIPQRKESSAMKRELKIRETDLLADDMFLPKRQKISAKPAPKIKKAQTIFSDEDVEVKKPIKQISIPKRKSAFPPPQPLQEKQKQNQIQQKIRQRNGLLEEKNINNNNNNNQNNNNNSNKFQNDVLNRQEKETSQRSNRASSDGVHGHDDNHHNNNNNNFKQQQNQSQKFKKQNQNNNINHNNNNNNNQNNIQPVEKVVVDEKTQILELQNWIKENFEELTDDDHPRLMSCLGLEADVESGEVELDVDVLTLTQLQKFKKFVIMVMNERKGGCVKYGSSSDGDEEVTSGPKKTSQKIPPNAQNGQNYHHAEDKFSPSSGGNFSRMQSGNHSSTPPINIVKESQKRKLKEMDVTDWYDLGAAEKSEVPNQSGVDSGGEGQNSPHNNQNNNNNNNQNQDGDIWDEFKKIDSQRERKKLERERMQEAAENAQRKRAQDIRNYQMLEEQRKKQAREKQMEMEITEINAQINCGMQNGTENLLYNSDKITAKNGGDLSIIGLKKKLAEDEDMIDTDEEQI